MSAEVQNEAKLDLPSPPKPLYPDVPWWAVLLTALVFSVVSVIATAAILNSGFKTPSSDTFVMPSAAGLALDTLVYMPHIILLFGVLADMFTYDGVWSIPSLIGVLSIFVNFVFRYFWVGIDELVKTAGDVAKKGMESGSDSSGNGSRPDPAKREAEWEAGLAAGKTGGAKGSFGTTYDGCSVQGFESFASEYAPQTLVVTATVFSYYCIDLIQNRGWVNSIAAVTAFVLTYIGQVAIIATTNGGSGCPPPPGKTPYSAISQGIRALTEGILFGGTSYGIVKTYYPTRLPSSTVSPFPRKTAADLTIGADGKMRDADGYPYVVLPNGQAVPDFGDKQSRLAFGSMVSNNLGSGEPATRGCPA
jgi:hypothetical protein